MNGYDISFAPPEPPGMTAPAPIPGVAPPPQDFSAAIEQIVGTPVATEPGTAPAATQPAVATQPGINPAGFYDPRILQHAEYLAGRYESPEAMEAAFQADAAQRAVDAALAEVDSQWAPLANSLTQQHEEGLITDEVYAQLRTQMNVQYNAARSNAETLAKMKPVYESVQQQQQLTAQRQQIERTVGSIVSSEPALKGAEEMLRNALLAGQPAHAAAASVLAFVRNSQPAPTLPAGTPAALPVTSRPAGQSQQQAVQMPDPLSDPAGFKAFEQQLMARHGGGFPL